MENVQSVSDDTLRSQGFNEAQIQAGADRPDGYVGEKNGVKYFRAQTELNINLGDHVTKEVRLPDQQGERS